mmetsp:Transcript_120/g.323  ORF Transcript_120/g.323 Transcript_120/m.323 type:complete len:237 (-) Transcript_120:306-1016(-)
MGCGLNALKWTADWTKRWSTGSFASPSMEGFSMSPAWRLYTLRANSSSSFMRCTSSDTARICESVLSCCRRSLIATVSARRSLAATTSARSQRRSVPLEISCEATTPRPFPAISTTSIGPTKSAYSSPPSAAPSFARSVSSLSTAKKSKTPPASCILRRTLSAIFFTSLSFGNSPPSSFHISSASSYRCSLVKTCAFRSRALASPGRTTSAASTSVSARRNNPRRAATAARFARSA